VPTVNEEAIVVQTIKEAIVAENNGEGSTTLEVTLSQIDGDFAKGMASDQGGGGMWFAAKVNGEWELVWDGNGIIQCSDLTNYPDFPTSMIPECYDDATQDMVVR